MLVKDKTEWYEETTEFIQNDLEGFYSTFYNAQNIKTVGQSLRLDPCPVCGHNDCCTVKEEYVKCFSGSCGWSGSHISAWYYYATNVEGISRSQATKRLEEYTGIIFPYGTEEDRQRYEKHLRIQEILSAAEIYYHEQLMNCETQYEYKGNLITPLHYLYNIRKRRPDTVKQFKIGFVKNYLELYHNLQERGFTKEEIKGSRIWAPDGLIIYFYRHPITRDIVRTNTKNPFEIREEKPLPDGTKVKGNILPGFSTGDKCMYYSPGFSFKKPFAMVEGENDLHALWENGCTNICATGGNLSQDEGKSKDQLSIIAKAESTIYEVFDHDEAGDKYSEILNTRYPDKIVNKINFSLDYNDIDEYYTKDMSPKRWDILVNESTPVVTEAFRVYHNGSTWVCAGRTKKLEFEISGVRSGSIIGNATLYISGRLIEKEIDVQLLKCKAKAKPYNFHLYDSMEEYFNSDLETKTLDELISTYWYSARRFDIVREIAQRVHASKEDDTIINKIKIGLRGADGSEAVVDAVLKELNDIKNKSVGVSLTGIQKIKICQYFNIKNDDAYMYFTFVKEDGDVKRKLPYLLRNDKTLIRLDLIKRKDDQCLLLLDNKYELPYEVTNAVLDLRECSLVQEWVEKYIADEIPKEKIKPILLIREIEEYIKKFYFSMDANIYKIVALFIYFTYYYELFGQSPYLFLNGQKGSGKSILDTVIYMLAFDAKMAVDISDSSLFRMVSLEGGTIILDEMESLTSRSKTQDSTMASILKAGYTKSGSIYRYNQEKNGIDSFNSYCPKVISNILGLEDIISDRCIPISTYRLTVTADNKKEDPKYYLAERLDEVRELTSMCSISALENFQELHDIYNKSLFESENARLSQIITPLLAVAKLVDKEERQLLKERSPELNELNIKGEYEKALIKFYEDVIMSSKEETDMDTPEGILKKSVLCIAKELAGIVPEGEKEYTNPNNHKYKEQIRFSIEEDWFEVNAVHFKCFIEENMPGDNVYARLVPKWIKTVFKIPKGFMKRKTVVIENEELLKEFKGNNRPKVNSYKFRFSDFIELNDEFLKPKMEIKKEASNDMVLF